MLLGIANEPVKSHPNQSANSSAHSNEVSAQYITPFGSTTYSGMPS